MKLLNAQPKTTYPKGHFYFGELGEVPHAVSLVDTQTPDAVTQEAKHYSKDGYKYFVVLKGSVEIEVNDEVTVVSAMQTLMVEPGEIHRVLRVVEAPCQMLVFGTVKDPTGTDKVVVE